MLEILNKSNQTRIKIGSLRAGIVFTKYLQYIQYLQNKINFLKIQNLRYDISEDI